MTRLTIVGITLLSACLLASSICGQHHFGAAAATLAGKNHLSVEPKVAPPPPSSGSLLSAADAENVRSSARSLATSNLNGSTGSGKLVSKVTPPPTKVQFINRFDPYDGATTTINPRLQTVKPGSVQTTTTERTVFVNNRFSQDETTTTTTTTTTRAPVTTTRAPVKPFSFQPVTFQPVTFQPVTFQQFPTTTYRPIVTTTYRPIAFNPAPAVTSSFTSGGAKKPFDIFDFYRQQYNPTKSPPAQPFHFSQAFKPHSILHQNQQVVTPKPFVFSQFENKVKEEVKPVAHPVHNSIPAHVHAVKPAVHHHHPVFTPVALVVTESKPELVANIVAERFGGKEEVKPVAAVPATSAKENLLEKNVAPPLAANAQKATFLPATLKGKSTDSGQKFINRFIVDEFEILDERTIPAKKKLEKDIEAPPVKNIRPILSPKISLHIGDSGHAFRNRFVLTEAEKLGKNTEPIKGVNRKVASPPVFKAGPQAVAQQSLVQPTLAQAKPTLPPPHLPSGRTDFTSRFEVDEVNKQLFQTLGSGGSVKPIQQQILFNNRYDEGSNKINLRPPAAGNSFGSESRAFQSNPNASGSLFSSLSSRLPNFDNFFKQ